MYALLVTLGGGARLALATRLAKGALGNFADGLLVALEKLFDLPRNIRQALLLVLDMAFVCAAMWLAVVLRPGESQFQPGAIEGACAFVTTVASALIFLRLGLYRAVIRFMGQQAIWAIIRGVSYSTMVLAACVFFAQAHVPRSLPFIYWGICLILVGGTRLLVRAYYQHKLRAACEKVIIYGAGESGRQLLNALGHGDRFRAVFFVDDDPRRQRTVINGVQVVAPSRLGKLIEEHDISQVLLALPSVSGRRRKEIINSLVGLPVYVRTVPKFNDLLLGRAAVGQIQDIELEDLLGRTPVPPHPELIERCIADKVVMVTGAGGSIGAELCRQILLSRPRELILLDNSEHSLYNIELELRRTLGNLDSETEVVALLGSVRDRQRMQQVFRIFRVQTVYHAAAYKHVPMVEYNVAEGVANNVFGTLHTAQGAVDSGVETFVLVSTDKAIRPTNIMGASKRFAEVICQGLAARQQATRFCMVRFGNVLGSSGSVVPLFREQIRAGGPLTVTHAEVSRYFMTIPEAAQLVLQAGAMGGGGDVFMLDMGEPVKIAELAERMLRLSGHTLRDGKNPDGDIEIRFIGLRPGEKLHEELLLGEHVTGTGHPMIMRAQEECPPAAEIGAWLKALAGHCAQMDCASIKEVLLAAVSGFEEHAGIYDHLWRKQRARSGEQPSNVQALFPGHSPLEQ